MKITKTLTISGAVALALGLAPLALAQSPSTAPTPATAPQTAQPPATATPEATSSPPPNVTASRTEIMQAQRALQKLGYNVGVDGTMGSQTRKALRNFQKVNGLSRTGRLDTDTQRGLGLIGGQPPAGLHLGGYTTVTVPSMAAPMSTSGMPQRQTTHMQPDLSITAMHKPLAAQRKLQTSIRRQDAMPTMPLIELVPVTLGTYKLVTSR